MTREIESVDELCQYLATYGSARGLRLQDLDLRGVGGTDLLAIEGSLSGLVVLGGEVPAPTVCELLQRGAVVFPRDPAAPIDPYRARLYTPTELYEGLEAGYAQTPDALAYAWSRDAEASTDAYTTTLRALHDDAIRDALHDLMRARRSVGVMGGHALTRDSLAYQHIAEFGRDLANSGYVVVTGGGPGAMEAANLGACDRTGKLPEALEIVAATPSFRPNIDAWVRTGLAARALLAAPDESDRIDANYVRSVGIPTWFYGHEPPNVFGDVIAKYFSNALREDDLLNVSRSAIVVLEGAAGTVQEIFQAATPLYYAPEGMPLPELILVGTRMWNETIPVWGALTSLGRGRPMAEHLHLVETLEEARAIIPE